MSIAPGNNSEMRFQLINRWDRRRLVFSPGFTEQEPIDTFSRMKFINGYWLMIKTDAHIGEQTICQITLNYEELTFNIETIYKVAETKKLTLLEYQSNMFGWYENSINLSVWRKNKLTPMEFVGQDPFKATLQKFEIFDHQLVAIHTHWPNANSGLMIMISKVILSATLDRFWFIPLLQAGTILTNCARENAFIAAVASPRSAVLVVGVCAKNEYLTLKKPFQILHICRAVGPDYVRRPLPLLELTKSVLFKRGKEHRFTDYQKLVLNSIIPPNLR
jgi:hypothetical protein